MTTEIEKKFFKALGIEPKLTLISMDVHEVSDGYSYSEKYREHYPKITDLILLELIVICLNNDFVVHSKNLDELQEKILYLLTKNANNKDILNTVRKLFGEEE